MGTCGVSTHLWVYGYLWGQYTPLGLWVRVGSVHTCGVSTHLWVYGVRVGSTGARNHGRPLQHEALDETLLQGLTQCTPRNTHTRPPHRHTHSRMHTSLKLINLCLSLNPDML